MTKEEVEVLARIARHIVRLEYKVGILEQVLIGMGIDKQTIQSAFDSADSSPATEESIRIMLDSFLGRL